MLTAKDFKTLSLQFTIFTPYLQFSPTQVLSKLLERFDSVFNGDPISLPLPPDAPQEIPQLILKDSDKSIKLEIARSRANFFRYLKKDEPVIDEDGFYKNGLNIFDEYIKCVSAKVGRLALITVRFLENDDPSKALATHFCKEDLLKTPFNHPESFEVHSHKKYSLNNFNINSWVRCKSGFMKKENKKIIIVGQDVNTLAEEIESKDFTKKEIADFIKGVPIEQKEILKKYFSNK